MEPLEVGWGALALRRAKKLRQENHRGDAAGLGNLATDLVTLGLKKQKI